MTSLMDGENIWYWMLQKRLKFSTLLESQNHMVGLGATFEGHLVQPPCSKQGHLQLGQVAQSPIQPSLECSQGVGIDHLSGKPGPGPHHPHREEFFFISNLNLPSFSLKPSPLVLLPPALVTAPLQLSHSSSRHWQLL